MFNKDDDPASPTRAVLYARVSTDDQRERQTIYGQIEALRNFAPHWNMTIVDEYLDDGISGTIPMGKRPEGARLMEDASADNFEVLIFYRLDRLARSLRNFLDIVDYFEMAGVGLRSMTETFDTTNPMGRFAVQMIAAVAELERGTIIERTSMGRTRIANQGLWTGGVVPYGYLVDDEGYLYPNSTPRTGYTFSEVDIVRRIYRVIADESGTAMAVARRLNEEGIPMWRKYHHRGQSEAQYMSKPGARWWPSNVVRIIRSETYKGNHVWGPKGQTIEREVPPLVDSDTWGRAQRQLEANRRLPKNPRAHPYLLRGLIRCGNCGYVYTGLLNHNGKGWKRYYYRCGSQVGEIKVGRDRCDGKLVGADWIENLVWDDITAFVSDPGEVVHQLKERMEAEIGGARYSEARKRELQQAIALKEGEKDRILDAYRRGLIDIEELETQVQRSREELDPLLAEMANIATGDAEVGRNVGRLVDAEGLLKQLEDRMQGTMDWTTKRQVIEALVWGIEIKTAGTGRRKQATVEITYAFDAFVHAVNNRMIGHDGLLGQHFGRRRQRWRRWRQDNRSSWQRL